MSSEYKLLDTPEFIKMRIGKTFPQMQRLAVLWTLDQITNSANEAATEKDAQEKVFSKIAEIQNQLGASK